MSASSHFLTPHSSLLTLAPPSRCSCLPRFPMPPSLLRGWPTCTSSPAMWCTQSTGQHPCRYGGHHAGGGGSTWCAQSTGLHPCRYGGPPGEEYYQEYSCISTVRVYIYVPVLQYCRLQYCKALGGRPSQLNYLNCVVKPQQWAAVLPTSFFSCPFTSPCPTRPLQRTPSPPPLTAFRHGVSSPLVTKDLLSPPSPPWSTIPP